MAPGTSFARVFAGRRIKEGIVHHRIFALFDRVGELDPVLAEIEAAASSSARSPGAWPGW